MDCSVAEFMVDAGIDEALRDYISRRDATMKTAGIHVHSVPLPMLDASYRRANAEVLAVLRGGKVRGRRIGAICSGAFVLVEAGFLAGLGAAIHWAYHDLMAGRFPEMRLRPNVFVAGPRFDTASAGTAAGDLMLHLIGRGHGEDFATEVADRMV